MAPGIDCTAFPHIFDQIVEYVDDPTTLLVLRPVSRELRDKADAKLYRHVGFATDPSTRGTFIRMQHPSGHLLPALPKMAGGPQVDIIHQRLRRLDVVDLIFPLVSGVMFDTQHLPTPRVLRVSQSAWGPDRSAFFRWINLHKVRASETAVYFTDGVPSRDLLYGPLNSGISIDPWGHTRTSTFFPMVNGVRRHVLNWCYGTVSGIQIAVLTNFCSRVRVHRMEGELIILFSEHGCSPSSLRRGHWVLTMLMRACARAKDVRGFKITFVGVDTCRPEYIKWQRDRMREASYPSQVEFLTHADYRDRIGYAQYELETVPPAPLHGPQVASSSIP
jgi:hypothetical protein